MTKYLHFLYLLLFPLLSNSQNFTGQWKGTFTDKSVSNSAWGGETCDYTIDLEAKNNSIKGYSYTYFTENGKKFYTICRLEGSIDAKKRILEIHEVERTKTNVPASIRNCFQIHRLSYNKKGQDEILSGEWVPQANQEGDCGFGNTKLVRHLLSENFSAGKNKSSGIARSVPKEASKTIPIIVPVNNIPPSNVAAATGIKKHASVSPAAPAIEQVSVVVVEDQVVFNNPDIKPEVAVKTSALPDNYKKRPGSLMKKIEVSNRNLKIQLFDNGEIDGDTISLFLNDNLILSHRKLTDKGIPFIVNLDEDIDENILEMYAENLGTIAPNTALMIINDGTFRYEVRITSDLNRSGIIKFILR